MSGNKASGLATAIDEMPVEVLDKVEAEQPGLFPMAALTPARPDDPEVVRTGQPGRPKGAKNKSTQEWSAYVLSQYQSPLIFLAETYSRPVEVLAKELCCDRLDAFKVQCASAGKLAEYIHQKQPMALMVDEKSAGVLVINTGLVGGDKGPKAGALGRPAAPEKSVDNQGLTNSENDKSDGEKSDDW